MEKLLLFTDGSVNVQTNLGIGAFLFIAENELSSDKLSGKVEIVRVENTSSTRLELQTLLSALQRESLTNTELVVFTDSQNILSLIERRNRLEKNNFLSKKNIPLKNADLYKQFFHEADRLNCHFQKVKGHQPSRRKNEIERIFSIVDKAARKALRQENNG